MKKILILLIGFSFTQSIQTKQVEVTINHINDYTLFGQSNDYYYGINIMDYIDEISGNYTVMLSNVTSGPINNSFGFRGCNQEGVTGYNQYNNSGSSYAPGLPITPGNIENNLMSYISADCPYIMIAEDKTGPDGLIDGTQSMTIIFWVKGLFEDEGVGLQGDMNDDEIINVVDIVALVNIIMGEEE